jgi:hypothetical protein
MPPRDSSDSAAPAIASICDVTVSTIGILQRHQDLPGADAVMPQHLRPDSRQRDLSHRGSALALLQLQRAARQF